MSDVGLTSTICIFDDKGKVLLVKRRNKPEQYKWSLPGGHLTRKNGKVEPFHMAAARELKEETGLTLPASRLEYVLNEKHNTGNCRCDCLFTAVYTGPVKSLKHDSDAMAIKWCALDDLPELAFNHNAFVVAAKEKLAI